MVQDFEELARRAKKQHRDMRESLSLMDKFMDLQPLPGWIKKVETVDEETVLRMVRINTAYELRWGITKDQYHGQTDMDIWGEEIGRQFMENDLKALKLAPEPYYTVEKVPDRLDSSGTIAVPIWRIGKIAHQHGEETYVMGVAWRSDCEEMRVFSG